MELQKKRIHIFLKFDQIGTVKKKNSYFFCSSTKSELSKKHWTRYTPNNEYPDAKAEWKHTLPIVPVQVLVLCLSRLTLIFLN